MDTNSLEELKAHLMATNEQYRHLAEEHSSLSHQLDDLLARPHMTPEDHLLEVDLKKRKLHLKDQMHEVLKGHQTSQAA